MASQVFFNGKLLTTPQTASAVNDDAMVPVANGVGNILTLVGTAAGGQPNTVLTFGDPASAQAALLSGDLYDAVSKVFAPSALTGGPSTVQIVRVGQSTPATLTLYDTSAAAAITLTSDQYGVPANQTKISIAAGSVTGLKVSVGWNGAVATGDNIANPVLSVRYTGAAASATVAVSGASVVLSAPAGTVVATLALATFVSVALLADAVSAVPGFAGVIQGSNATAPTVNSLDSAAATDCKTAAFVVTANRSAVIAFLNSAACPFVQGAAAAGSNAALAPISWTYLTGGTDPAVLTQDWTNALAVLQTADTNWLALLTPNPAIWAAGDAHCQYMSTAGGRERRMFTGPAVGTSLAAALALPIALNSDRSSVCWPGYWDYNSSGVLTLYPPYMLAAILAGMAAGVSPGTPLTNKPITVRGLEVQIARPAQTDQAIQAGLLVVEATRKGFLVTRSISTWLFNNAFDRVEISCGAALDFAAQTVRDAVDAVRGNANGPRLLARALSAAETALNLLAVPPPLGSGAIVGDANSPAWQGLRGTISGDVVTLSFQCSPVIPANFVLVAIACVPYSGSASVSNV